MVSGDRSTARAARRTRYLPPRDLAIRYAQRDMPIKRNGDIGKDCGRVSNTHAIITEYRRSTGAKHGRDHFMAALAEAERCGHLTYRVGRSHAAAGYVEVEIPF